MYIHTHTYTYMHLATINVQRDHEFGEQIGCMEIFKGRQGKGEMM